MDLKEREWYRPLAPIALEKNTKYFTGLNCIHPLSKYMLLDFQVIQEKQNEICGAIHADGTARFQTIFKRDENPFIYDLMDFLDKKFGIRAIINTSFNSRGMPIVHTENDAINEAKKLKLDGIVLNGRFDDAF
jgi:carbamoyltransferase